MNTIYNNITKLRDALPSDVCLVAVSKYFPSSAVQQAYDAGQRIFAESRPQELVAKVAALPKDIQWHFIGHLQTNKLKMVLPYVSLIQSVDSTRLLEAIDSSAPRLHPQGKVDVLLECHISHEDSKQGFSLEEAREVLSSWKYKNIRPRGLMGMASLTSDTDLITNEFTSLRLLFDELTSLGQKDFDILSMGMSGDYNTAIECGANMVRIGSAIFA